MTNESEMKLDRALDALARDVDGASPRPTPDLIARVLADAAVAAPAARPVTARQTRPDAAPRRLHDLLFGWASSAVAAMAIALVVGIGVGMELDTGDLPLLEPDDDGIIIMADGALMPEEVL